MNLPAENCHSREACSTGLIVGWQDPLRLHRPAGTNLQLTCLGALRLLPVLSAGLTHSEDVTNLWLIAPLRLSPGLGQLLGPHVGQRAAVLEQWRLAAAAKPAEDAVEGDLAFGVLKGSLRLAEVAEQEHGYFVDLAVNMSLQLVQGIGVVVAGVTSQLCWVGPGEHVQLPLVGGTTFSYVVEKCKSCQVLVRLAMQLEVCLEVCFVGAQFADMSAGDDHGDLAFPGLVAPVHRHMGRDTVQAVGVELVTDAAVEKLGGVGVPSLAAAGLPLLTNVTDGRVVPGSHQLQKECLIVGQIHHHHGRHVSKWSKRRHWWEVGPGFWLHHALQHLQALQLFHVLLDCSDVLNVLVAGHVDPQVTWQACLVVAYVATPGALLRQRVGGV